eukprot:5437934-Pyramimonas_sp.AAC.2
MTYTTDPDKGVMYVGVYDNACHDAAPFTLKLTVRHRCCTQATVYNGKLVQWFCPSGGIASFGHEN